MIWVTWRQHRMEALAYGGALALLALLLLTTGLHLRSEYDSLGITACLLPQNSGAACDEAIRSFNRDAVSLAGWMAWLNFLPGLAGLFVGAPLVARELERGTHQLAWTQGVTRSRWLVVKLALLGAGLLLVAAAFAALMTWWHGPVDSTGSRLEGANFDLEGITPIAYTLFAFALGTLAGTLLRHTVVAMAVTIGGFLAVRLPVANLLRQHYQAPLTSSTQLPTGSGAWVLDGQIVGLGGQAVTPGEVATACPGFKLPGGSPDSCLHDHFATLITYHPADRFWTFQLIESGIFLGLALIAVTLAVYWVRRRLR